MSAIIQKSSATAAESDHPINDSMTRIGQNQVTLTVFKLSNELQALYNSMQDTLSTMTETELKAQGITTLAASNFQIQAAEFHSDEIRDQAYGSLAGAATTIVGLGAGSLFSRGINTEIDGKQNDLKYLNTLKTPAGPPMPVIAEAQMRPVETPLTARAQQLRNGEFQPPGRAINAQTTADDQTAVQELSTIRSTKGGSLRDEMIRGPLNREAQNLQGAITGQLNKVTTAQQQGMAVGTLLKGVSDGTCQHFQADAAADSGDRAAKQQIADGASRMASSTADVTRQKLGTMGDLSRAATDDALSAAKSSTPNV
jgi:hypothetical protein